MGWGGAGWEAGKEGKDVEGKRQPTPQGRMEVIPPHTQAGIPGPSQATTLPTVGFRREGHPVMCSESTAVAGLGALHPALAGVNSDPYPNNPLPRHRADTPGPAGALQPPWTVAKALWGGACARMSGSKCACVTMRVHVRLGVRAREGECGRPVSSHYPSESLFCSQGEWGFGVESEPGDMGLEGQGDVGPPLAPGPWTIHEMGHQETAGRS